MKTDNIKFTILAITTLSLVSCGWFRKSDPPLPIPPAPPVSESAKPVVDIIEGKVGVAVKINATLQEKLAAQKNVIMSQKTALAQSVADTVKLRENILANKAIQEIDAINMRLNLNLTLEKTLLIEQYNDELSKACKEQEILLNDAQVNLGEALYKLALRDSEILALRDQNKYYGVVANDQNKKIESLKKELAKKEKEAATAQVYRKWVIGIIVGFVLWTIIKNLIMIYSPIKFRI